MKDVKSQRISKREKEVLRLIAYENSTKEIARELFISQHTVVTHRKNLLFKMDVKNTAGLVRKAFEYGYLTLSHNLTLLLMLVLFTSSASLSAQCHTDDFTALKELYSSTFGDIWTTNTNWDLVRDNPACPPLLDLSILHGIGLDANGRVDSIRLRNNNLGGLLPDELGLLAELRTFNVSKNIINGAIPDTLGTLPDLEKLLIHDNALSDQSLPVAGFPSLKVYSVTDNDIRGGIPPEIANITTLEEIWLSNNPVLLGHLPSELGNLSNLTTLRVGNCGLDSCFAPNLINLCGQLTNTEIDDMNSFDAGWESFCSIQSGMCMDCSDTSIKWTGHVSNNWATAGNWSSGCVPAPGDTVIIDNGETVYINSGTEAKCMSITLDNGGELVVFNGGKLRLLNSPDCGIKIIDGNFTNSGRAIIKNTTNDAIINSGTLSNTDTLIIENAGAGITGRISQQGYLKISNIHNSYGIADYGFPFRNSGHIEIDTIAESGIIIQGKLTNSGTITINNVGLKGIECGSEIINEENKGIRITNCENGIEASDSLINNGKIHITGASESGLICNGPLTNKDTIIISNSEGGIGIEEILTNSSYIYLDSIGEEGASIDGQKSMYNTGTIHITNSGEGINIADSLINDGSITFQNLTEIALNCEEHAVNNSDIIITNSESGIEFGNSAINNGTIKVSRCYGSGGSTFTVRGRFDNYNIVDIDSVSTGISNRDTIINFQGGTISVIQVSDESGNYGTESLAISNDGYIENNGVIEIAKSGTALSNYGTFLNNLILIIEESGWNGNDNLGFYNSGHFTNNSCGGQFILKTGMHIEDLLLNKGTLIQEFSGANTLDGDTLENLGLMIDQQTAPPNVLNNAVSINEGVFISNFNASYSVSDTVHPFILGPNTSGITFNSIKTWNGATPGNIAGIADLANNEFRPNAEAVGISDFILEYQLPGCGLQGAVLSFDNAFRSADCILNTWVGSVSTDWFTDGNWSLDHVPTSGESVIIPDASTVVVPSGMNADCKLLDVATNANVTIDGQITVWVVEP